jgi:hypothetical protein
MCEQFKKGKGKNQYRQWWGAGGHLEDHDTGDRYVVDGRFKIENGQR